jgi:plastocyanin
MLGGGRSWSGAPCPWRTVAEPEGGEGERAKASMEEWRGEWRARCTPREGKGMVGTRVGKVGARAGHEGHV